MAHHIRFDHLRSKDVQVPVGLNGLCDELSRADHRQLEQTIAAMARLAPRPGTLVYVQTSRLAIRVSGFEPVVFSAIDASTLLQVAQSYLTTTTAAAISFVEFMTQSYPFRVSHIRTRDEKPFVNASSPERCRDFTALMSQKGLGHTVSPNASQDPLFILTSKLTFGGISEGFIPGASEYELQRELARFLFFHNNYRSVPWLGGMTPVQKLGSFDGFPPMDAFDPYGSIVSNQLSVRRIDPSNDTF